MLVNIPTLTTEAAQAAIDWRRDAGIEEIEAFIDSENTPSVALAFRLGMTTTAEIRDGAQRYLMSL